MNEDLRNKIESVIKNIERVSKEALQAVAQVGEGIVGKAQRMYASPTLGGYTTPRPYYPGHTLLSTSVAVRSVAGGEETTVLTVDRPLLVRRITLYDDPTMITSPWDPAHTQAPICSKKWALTMSGAVATKKVYKILRIGTVDFVAKGEFNQHKPDLEILPSELLLGWPEEIEILARPEDTPGCGHVFLRADVACKLEGLI